MSAFRAWLIAIRPKTLPAAISPVLLGWSIAIRARGFLLGPALAALLGALLLQIAANLANDVCDYEKGTDKPDRLGPIRVVSAGLLSARQVYLGLGVAMLLALCAGSYLVSIAGPAIGVLGLFAAASAVGYTAGPFPIAYQGLGDLFVFLFFGPVAVAGTAFVQLGTIPSTAWFAGISQGALATNILVVNNLRDLHQDERAGKRTLAVRFGEFFCVAQYATLLLVAFSMPAYLWITGDLEWPALVSFLALPPATSTFLQVRRVRGRGLNTQLARTAGVMMAFGLLFSLGIAVKL